MTVSDGEWVGAAMADDVLVAEILLRCKTATVKGKEKEEGAAAGLELRWSGRQPRSRPVPRTGGEKGKEKMKEKARASPTTPLSWSGATSGSGGGGGGGNGGGGDGFEETSADAVAAGKSADNFRSKAPSSSGIIRAKRLRRKKTLAELREEESFLLSERRGLQNELENLRLFVKKERAENEILKRRKADTGSSCFNDAASVSASVDPKPSRPAEATRALASASTSSHGLPERETINSSSFMLPDLNLPLDEDPTPNLLYGTS